MIQDIAPHIFRNEYTPKAPDAESYALYFDDDKVLVRLDEADRTVDFPRFADLPGALADAGQYLFSVDGIAYFLCAGVPALPGAEYRWERPQIFREYGPGWRSFAGITAAQLYRWYRGRTFCGRCGTPMQHDEKERAMFCPQCQTREYPKLSPAVIVAVTNGDKLLLSRYANSQPGRYALVAGFTEIGETIEGTVHREVMEEVGIKVKNLRYYKSQPWSFTDSLLVGFYCELDGSPEITLDKNELAEAVWMPRDEIAPASTDISLTSEMIQGFRLSKI